LAHYEKAVITESPESVEID
jgi:hypothetical protein